MDPSTVITRDHYGKGAVRVLKRLRREEGDRVVEVTADIRFEGDFGEAFIVGDNRRILPTDTMKNTVYALAKDYLTPVIEPFALSLAQHFIDQNPQVRRVEVDLVETPWHEIVPHTLRAAGDEKPTCRVTRTRDTVAIEAGVRGLRLLKTHHSGFADYLEDEYTTLRPTDDRLLGTDLEASWRYAGPEVDFAACRDTVRRILIETFATHESRSVQHTLYAMGDAVLTGCEEVDFIRLGMPNKHRLPVDLTPFGLINDGTVFMPVEEPYGVIEATLARP